MGQKKLQRFAEIKTFPNVLEYPENMLGKWNEFFKNTNPIVLELACGKGEYAVGLGRLHPERNYIGVDIKGNRMWVGAKKALNEGLTNVAFLRTLIERIDEFFVPGEVAEIWLTFPDPQLSIKRAKKRLTYPRFLSMYQKMMGKQGIVNLKTDSPHLYNFTKQVINIFGLTILSDIDDVFATEPVSDEMKIKTHYEQLDIAQSNRIHYLRFVVDQDFAADKIEQLKQRVLETEND
ncbi:MAG: trmB [Segetibacter sp.]|nr:trmB [Segetibacter sp.]